MICLRKHCAHIAMTHDCIWLMEPAFGMILLLAYQLLSLATRFNLDQLTSTSFCKKQCGSVFTPMALHVIACRPYNIASAIHMAQQYGQKVYLSTQCVEAALQHAMAGCMQQGAGLHELHTS